ncbi:MAG: Mu-like prophage major head subunit gpT family protein, partial [Chloroflexota bacterium]
PAQIVEAVPVLKSCDVVTRASAGGRFLGEGMSLTPALSQKEREQVQEGVVDVTEQTGLTVLREDGSTMEVGASTSTGEGSGAGMLGTPRDEQRAALAAVREAQVRLECAHVLSERLQAATLPAALKVKVRKTWDPFGEAQGAGMRWEASEGYARALEGAIDAELAALAALRDSGFWGPLGQDGGAGQDGQTPGRGDAEMVGIVRGLGAARVEAGVDGMTRGRAAVQVALDRLFGVQESADDPDVVTLRRAGAQAPRWTSLREAYAQITGDAAVTGWLRPDLSVVREANEVTTSVLNQALLNSMTKRLVQDYAGQPQDWRKFSVIRALRDFKSQDRIRLHDFGSLSTVAEGAAYTNLPWDDAKEAYAPTKKGNLVVVTREAILNDDLDAIRKIPTKLAIAAGITINEFVYGLFTSNPVMSDGTTVFDDGVQASHGNRGTAALSATALQDAITAMMKQTNSAGKRLNLRPRYLLVPPDLLFTALTIVNSSLVPGSANNDVNVLQGVVEPISVAQFTDVTDWYVMADPALVEGLEVGFVGGREAPDLLLQDAPTAGMVFTNDQISFRVRWEFGGGWVDYRGAFWAQVAG